MALLDFLVDAFSWILDLADSSARLERERTAHAMAAGRVWGWDSDLIRRIISTYDPLPDSAGVEHTYARVAESVCGNASISWRDARSIRCVLESELRMQAQGDRVDTPAVRRLARRLAKEYRRHVSYLSVKRLDVG